MQASSSMNSNGSTIHIIDADVKLDEIKFSDENEEIQMNEKPIQKPKHDLVIILKKQF
jgi:hypothetical protein